MPSTGGHCVTAGTADIGQDRGAGAGAMPSTPIPSWTRGCSAPLWAQQPQVRQEKVPEGPLTLMSKVWECRALRLEPGGRPVGWAQGRLTVEPGHCSPGAGTCRAQRRSTWGPRPSAAGAWGAVGGLWVSDGRAMPSSLHLLALTLLPGGWEVGHRLLGQPLLLAVLTHPRGDWARMQKGILCCLRHPETARPWGNRSGSNRHWVSGGRVIPLPLVTTPPSMAHPVCCRLRINDGAVILPLALFSPACGSVTFLPHLADWGWCQRHLTCCPGLFSSGPDPSLSAGAVNTADARGERQGVRQQEDTAL